MSLLVAETVAVSIEAPPERVYDFVSNPENLPIWATAFCRSAVSRDATWVVQTPTGASLTIRFVERNALGVLDHIVGPPPTLNPMRVVANGSGSEVMFTVLRAAGVSESTFRADVTSVRADLQTLKRVLEHASDDGSSRR